MTAPTAEAEGMGLLEGMRAVRATRPTTTRRTTRPAKAAPKKQAPSRAESAAKRGKYADRIVGAIKSGCAILGLRRPVEAAIIETRAESWAAALDRVAAEDKRVDAFLQKVSGFFGKGSAWGDLAGETAITGSALMLSMGAVPTGPVGMAVAFMGGSVVEAGVQRAAQILGERDATAAGYGEGHPERDAAVADLARQHADQLAQEIAARRVQGAPIDEPTVEMS